MRRILDTSELCSYWNHRSSALAGHPSPETAKAWPQALCELHDTKVIVTPVWVEFIAGARSKPELDAYRAYLSVFDLIDDGRVSEEDWKQAKRLAGRIPRDGKPGQLGDCLIAALAIRFGCAVKS
jgi:predicted nucleic acid-binding protein